MRREEDRWGRNRTAAAGFHHREYRAAGARGVGRRERRQQDIDDHHRIAQRQRALAHELHQEQRDAPPQPGGLVAQREDKGAEHQPDGGGRSPPAPFQRLFTGLEARLRQLLRAEQHPVGAQHADGHCDKADGGGRIGSRIMPTIIATKMAKCWPAAACRRAPVSITGSRAPPAALSLSRSFPGFGT